MFNNITQLINTNFHQCMSGTGMYKGWKAQKNVDQNTNLPNR